MKSKWMFAENIMVYPIAIFFGEWNIIILLQCSSLSTWVFLDNLRDNINLPLTIQEHRVMYYNLVT